MKREKPLNRSQKGAQLYKKESLTSPDNSSATRRTLKHGIPLNAQNILFLQKTINNRAVRHLIQAKSDAGLSNAARGGLHKRDNSENIFEPLGSPAITRFGASGLIQRPKSW